MLTSSSQVLSCVYANDETEQYFYRKRGPRRKSIGRNSRRLIGKRKT